VQRIPKHLHDYAGPIVEKAGFIPQLLLTGPVDLLHGSKRAYAVAWA
jgi:hypothetical protein